MPRRSRRRRIVGRILDHLTPQARARRAFPDPLPDADPWTRVDLAWATTPLGVLR